MEERKVLRKENTQRKKRARLTVRDNRDLRKKRRIIELKKKDRRFRIIASIITFLALGFVFTLFMMERMSLNRKIDEYNSLQADVMAYELQKDNLNKKVENAIDLPRIQRYALEELGMVYRDDENTVKLNVDRN